MNSTDSKSNITFIQILRGLAALIVVGSHWFVMFFVDNKTCSGIGLFNAFEPSVQPFWTSFWGNAKFLNLGMLGVSIFFYITGYLISPSLEYGGGGTSKFIKKKILRLYPLYFIGLLFTVCVVYISARNNGIPFPYDMSVFVKNFSLFRFLFWVPTIDGVEWTMECQVFFYLFCALQFWIINTKWNSEKSIILTSGIFTLVIYISGLLNDIMLNNTFKLYVLFFYLTICFHNYIIMIIGNCFYNYTSNKWSLKKFITILLVEIAFVTLNFRSLYFDLRYRYYVSYGIGLFIFVIFWLMKDKLYNNKLFYLTKKFATISFPFYIIHGAAGYAIMAMLYNYVKNPYFLLIISMTIFIIIATILHYLIEIPIQNMSKKFFNP